MVSDCGVPGIPYRGSEDDWVGNEGFELRSDRTVFLQIKIYTYGSMIIVIMIARTYVVL